jgi:hypothetical protein
MRITSSSDFPKQNAAQPPANRGMARVCVHARTIAQLSVQSTAVCEENLPQIFADERR